MLDYKINVFCLCLFPKATSCFLYLYSTEHTVLDISDLQICHAHSSLE